MPHDLAIGDVYVPPLLAAAVIALVTAALTCRGMRSIGLMGYFANPALVFISITIIYTVLLGSTVLPS